MGACLGLDIGSNSVGSAWADLERDEFHIGVSVFPAGVEEQEDKRGAPKNQSRRLSRSQRRLFRRRAQRKRELTEFLIRRSLLPRHPHDDARCTAGTPCLRCLYDLDPLPLRRRAILEPVSASEFGRIIMHLAQRRGARGVTSDPNDENEGKVKEGMDRLRTRMEAQPGMQTLGQFLADRKDRSVGKITAAPDVNCNRRALQRRRARRERWIERGKTPPPPHYCEPIRNRQYRLPEEEQLFAGRELLREEFHAIVRRQREFKDSELSRILTDELIRELDDPTGNGIWRHRGLLFGQRRTYWDTGTLGRCDLEPTDRCAPIADRHASYFRVLETVNNIRIESRAGAPRLLEAGEREKVLKALRGPLWKSKARVEAKTSASVKDVKEALGMNPRDRFTRLNLENDAEREINTDWFHREIVHGAFGEERWNALQEPQREAINLALLRLNPEEPADSARLREYATRWWRLDANGGERLVSAWQRRPKIEKRLNLSRRAVRNLLPLMIDADEQGRWRTQQEARKAFAKTLPQGQARERYETAALGLTAADRRYMRLAKHRVADGIPALPPAPILANPVVRKAIHEVRRHLVAYLRMFGRRPDRVIIEMARITKQSEKQRNLSLARNRNREKIRAEIIDRILPDAFGPERARKLSLNQQRSAVDRVVLARQQSYSCPYCGNGRLTDAVAARGDDLEIDHIVPYSRCGDNGLNNKLLVHRNCNRGKTNLTPREWWGAEFENHMVPAERLFKDAQPAKGDYFTKHDHRRKWDNFTRQLSEEREWKNSQLTDTAYAAREVAAYLADALFDGRGLPERGDGSEQQKIFFTVGSITATLRRDWQLFETLKSNEDARAERLTAAEELQLAQKDRGDHRQHGLDAITIALTDPRIKFRLASEAARAAELRDKFGIWPKRTPVPVPWGTVRSFRQQILARVYTQLEPPESAAGTSEVLIVAHRPVKRRIMGALHKQTLYGAVLGADGLRVDNRVTIRQPIYKGPQDHITPAHLRMPVPETRDQSIDRIAAQLTAAGVRKRDARRRAAETVDRSGFIPQPADPPPGKTGIVRDSALRRVIRNRLCERGMNPDRFTAKQLKESLDHSGPIRHISGVPIKSAVLLWTNNDPVAIPRRHWNPATGKMEASEDPRTVRLYDAQNNHHIEIRCDTKGRWKGEVVRTIDAARRNIERLAAIRVAGIPSTETLRRMPSSERIQFRPLIAEAFRRFPIVNRNDGLEGPFIMSLAEGEMVFARRWDPVQGRAVGNPEYFVVCKLDRSSRIHFAAHWDARKTSEQDRWDVVPADLKHCGPEPGRPPLKVHVSPLGVTTELHYD